MVAAGAENVIVTNAAAAALAFERNGTAIYCEPPQIAVVDTTGAGDAFRAGVVYGHLAGYSLAHSMSLGVAAGSLAVASLGAASEPASIDNVERIAASLTIT
jgi:ribokinase